MRLNKNCVSSARTNRINNNQSPTNKNPNKLSNANKKPENSIEPFAIVIISVILIVTLIQCFFCMNNFEYVGLVIGFSDYVLNFTFIFSNVGVVVANFLICYIWEKFPF